MDSMVFVSDFHAGHEDRSAISCCLEYCRRTQPAVIVLGGDVYDCEELYKSSRGLRQATGVPGKSGLWTEHERVLVRGFLRMFRAACPQSRIVLLAGNHDDRIGRTAAACLPQLYGAVPSFEDYTGLKEWNVEYAQELTAAGWYLHHGWRYGIYACRNAMQDQMGSTCQGHTHRLKIHSQTTASGRRVTHGVEAGCMCKIEAAYMARPNPDWQQGFVSFHRFGHTLAPLLHPIYRGETLHGSEVIRGWQLHAAEWARLDDELRKRILEIHNL